jgi:hypothetical protein
MEIALIAGASERRQCSIAPSRLYSPAMNDWSRLRCGILIEPMTAPGQ